MGDNWGYVPETNTESLMYNSGISVLPLNLLEIEDNEDDEYYDYIQNGQTIDNAKDIEYDSVDYGEALQELEDEDYDMKWSLLRDLYISPASHSVWSLRRIWRIILLWKRMRRKSSTGMI